MVVYGIHSAVSTFWKDTNSGVWVVAMRNSEQGWIMHPGPTFPDAVGVF